MPIDYRIDADSGLVVTTFTGQVTDAELLAHAERIDADPAVVGRGELVDIRQADPSGLTTGVLRGLASAASATSTVKRIAVLANADLAYGLARMFEMVADGPGLVIAVFRDEAAALAYLVPQDDVGAG